METEINIVEILKDKPQGTKLYSSACGKCKLEEVDDKSFKISFYNSKFGFMNGGEGYLDKNGKLYDDGECVVFPSKEMRNWSKFAWKKGDVLINSCGLQCIFKEWASDDYTKFNGCYSNSRDGYEDVSNAETAKFDKLDNNTAYGYIREIENRYCGKLNLESLEIEKTQPEFKDGDILYAEKDEEHVPVIFILKITKEGRFYYAGLALGNYILCDYNGLGHVSNAKFRFATEEEKKKLFDILAIEGKAWDAEKKEIVDLKPNIELKPFDKVLSRRCSEDYWVLNFYSHKADYYHICIDGSSNLYCIPYNEETAHLLGTTDDWEGGKQ